MSNWYGNRLEVYTKSLVKDEHISETDRKLILDYRQDCFARGLSKARVLKLLYCVTTLRRRLGIDFADTTLDDVKNLVVWIEQSDYAEYTKHDFKIVLKLFFKWLKKTEGYPDEVRWIKPRLRCRRTKLPEDLLSEEDIRKMVEVADNPRDRAIVSLLYESGCRIGELCSLLIKHIHFDQFGAQLIVDGKTGPRRVRVVSSVPYLSDWLNHHPNKTNSEATLWTWKKGLRPIDYRGIVKVLEIIGKRAGVTRRVNPHNFRHSRATYLANYLTEAQMKEFFGWVQASEMASVYVHLSGRDVDKALLKTYGLNIEESKEISQLAPKACPRCRHSNASTNKFCSNCSMVLDENEAMAIIRQETEQKYHEQVDGILDFLLHDPKFLKMFSEKFKEYGDSLPVKKASEA